MWSKANRHSDVHDERSAGGSTHGSRRAMALLAAAVVLGLAGWSAASALAAPGGAGLTLDGFATPTHFSPAHSALCASTVSNTPACDAYVLTLTDAGSGEASGPVLITNSLPAGLRVERIGLQWSVQPGTEFGTGGEFGEALCRLSGAECEFPIGLAPDATLRMTVYVTTEASSGALVDRAVVSAGGGVAPVATLVENEVSAEPAAFGVSGFSAYVGDADGHPEVRAGAHPYEFTTRLDLDNLIRTPPDGALPAPNSSQDVKDVVVDLPIGLLGSAVAAPRCKLAQLASPDGCPRDAIVGHLLTMPVTDASVNGPIYNLVPERGVAAEFGYTDLLNGTHVLDAHVVPTPEGYVLRTESVDVPQVPLTDLVASFYGDPAERDGGGGEPLAMFTDPSDCSGAPLTSKVYVDSWQNPGGLDAEGAPELKDPGWIAASSTMAAPSRAPGEAATPLPVTGCNALRFQTERFSTQPDATAADSPTGLGFELAVPQPEDPGTLATPTLRDARVRLPRGLTLDPSVAAGLGACTVGEVGWLGGSLSDFTAGPPECPDSSKIGTLELSSPLLATPLEGSIYLAAPFDNPYDSRFAAYLVVDDPQTGVVVKIPGKVDADAETGQITGIFEDNPQFPFSALSLHFFGGQRAPLTTPPTCGTYTTESELEPWSAPDSGPDATPRSEFTITAGAGGSACPAGEGAMTNHPAFEAGTTSQLAGTYAPFVLRLSREDGSQRLARIDTVLPEGLLGKLAGVSECSDASIAAAATRSGRAEEGSPSCPGSSQIGVVDVGAGSGAPFHVPGRVYLAGPYKGAPLSLAVITPAVAGPFDLGTVVVRVALDVDPLTTQIHAVSDPLPSILDGVPLDVRSIELKLDRPEFSRNPTSCAEKQISGAATTTLGQVATLQSHFQAVACAALAFKPKLAISLKGSTKHAGHPALKAVLTYPKQGAYANVARAQVNLPSSEFLDQANLNKTCTRPVLLAGDCPASTVYGRAEAWSPLLDKPLEGPVYLVGGFGYKLPALVAELDGQIRVLLVGKVDSGKNHGIRNTFEAVPDAPVEKFVLEMKGGKKYSLLENSQNLCAAPQKAIARFTGQNGAVETLKLTIANDCGKKKGKGAKKKGSGPQHGKRR